MDADIWSAERLDLVNAFADAHDQPDVVRRAAACANTREFAC
jgi:hypothetical protein